MSKVNGALDIYQEIGIDESYQTFIATFANVMVGGQAHSSGGSDNPMGGDGFDMDYWLGFDWVYALLIGEYEAFYDEYDYDDGELTIDEKGDNYVLSLSDNDWELITDVEQRVFLDDGEGYIRGGL